MTFNLFGVQYLTGPSSFSIQGLVDNGTQNKTGESLFYPVVILASLK